MSRDSATLLDVASAARLVLQFKTTGQSMGGPEPVPRMPDSERRAFATELATLLALPPANRGRGAPEPSPELGRRLWGLPDRLSALVNNAQAWHRIRRLRKSGSGGTRVQQVVADFDCRYPD